MVGHGVRTWGFPPIPEHAKSPRGPGFWMVGRVRPCERGPAKKISSSPKAMGTRYPTLGS